MLAHMFRANSDAAPRIAVPTQNAAAGNGYMPQKSPIPAPTSTHRSGLKLRQTSMNDFAQILSKAGSYLGFAEAAGDDPAVQLEAIRSSASKPPATAGLSAAAGTALSAAVPAASGGAPASKGAAVGVQKKPASGLRRAFFDQPKAQVAESGTSSVWAPEAVASASPAPDQLCHRAPHAQPYVARQRCQASARTAAESVVENTDEADSGMIFPANAPGMGRNSPIENLGKSGAGPDQTISGQPAADCNADAAIHQPLVSGSRQALPGQPFDDDDGSHTKQSSEIPNNVPSSSQPHSASLHALTGRSGSSQAQRTCKHAEDGIKQRRKGAGKPGSLGRAGAADPAAVRRAEAAAEAAAAALIREEEREQQALWRQKAAQAKNAKAKKAKASRSKPAAAAMLPSANPMEAGKYSFALAIIACLIRLRAAIYCPSQRRQASLCPCHRGMLNLPS